jgi:hypothetical protein
MSRKRFTSLAKNGSAPKSEYEPKGNAGLFGGHAESRNFSASTAKINKDMETNYKNWEDFNKGEEYREFYPINIRRKRSPTSRVKGESSRSSSSV